MLSKLFIQNYALIDTVEIDFSNGLNIITGETGAGKSIILGALSLILGQRLEHKTFFNQDKKCIIEGRFFIGNYQLQDFFEAQNIDYEEETILRREITAEGRSRAFINDSPVSLTQIKDLTEQLVDIHSQHAILELNSSKFHFMVLDILSAQRPAVEKYTQDYKLWKNHQKELAEIVAASLQAKSDADYNQFQFDELESAHLQIDEQSILEQELSTLNHTGAIQSALNTSTYLIEEAENGVLPTLKEAQQQLQSVANYHPDIAPLWERLKSSLIEIKDINTDLQGIASQTISNDGRVLEISERLNTLYSLHKKHRVSSNAELLELQAQFSGKLQLSFQMDENIAALELKIEELQHSLAQKAQEISSKRRTIAPLLKEKIEQTLAQLGMIGAQFEAVISQSEALNIHGMDDIDFMFSANKGHTLAKVSKVASGGELSRLMLSIKQLIAQQTALPTLIFDEIDTGISGEVALQVGNIMGALSQQMQVIAITHLPQIAAKGDHHLFVFKADDLESTKTQIKVLDAENRIVEIAKMLSGNVPSAAAMENAKILIAN